MKKPKTTQAKLITVGGGELARDKDPAPPSDFLAKMLFYPDAQEAAQIVGEQAGLEFDQSEGGELALLELEQAELNDHYAASNARGEALEEKRKNTKQYIKYAAARGEDPESKTTFATWRRQDQISIIFLIIALITAMIMGSANVYSNLMASGEPIFIEKPALALFLSLLVPAGSAALKFISNFFDYDKTKRRYALGIYALTALSLLIWTVCFSLSFSGISGGIDFDSLGESDSSGTFLVWIQLVTEILVAGALFLAAEDIYNKYAPESYTTSLEYMNVENALKQYRVEHQELREQRAQNHARITELAAKRQAFMNERIADYLAKRSRMHSINNV